MGLPMGVDVCYTNHVEADQDDMDNLSTLLAQAGVSFVITVPGADDVMLGYQSLAFEDIAYLREITGLTPAPEFARWLGEFGLAGQGTRALPDPAALARRQNSPPTRHGSTCTTPANAMSPIDARSSALLLSR